MTSDNQYKRNIKIIVEYDGTGLSGWQRQAGDPTVQEFLETAIGRIVNESVTVIGAGRTDAGVHARGMVANFKTDSPRKLVDIVRGTNALLPDQIVVLTAEEVPLDFHARYSVISKTYDYDLFVSPVRSALNRNYAWHLHPGLDFSSMRQALELLVGEHDFAAFQSTGSNVKTSVRCVIGVSILEKPDNLFRISIEADGFLRHMVRAIVGTLIEVGRGRMGIDQFRAVLEAQDRSHAGPTAPAHGLFLREVKYSKKMIDDPS